MKNILFFSLSFLLFSGANAQTMVIEYGPFEGAANLGSGWTATPATTTYAAMPADTPVYWLRLAPGLTPYKVGGTPLAKLVEEAGHNPSSLREGVKYGLRSPATPNGEFVWDTWPESNFNSHIFVPVEKSRIVPPAIQKPQPVVSNSGNYIPSAASIDALMVDGGNGDAYVSPTYVSASSYQGESNPLVSGKYVVTKADQLGNAFWMSIATRFYTESYNWVPDHLHQRMMQNTATTLAFTNAYFNGVEFTRHPKEGDVINLIPANPIQLRDATGRTVGQAHYLYRGETFSFLSQLYSGSDLRTPNYDHIRNEQDLLNMAVGSWIQIDGLDPRQEWVKKNDLRVDGLRR